MAKAKIKYYSLYKILKKNAIYNVIYGKRSNGKTYAALLYGLKQYFKNGSEIAYIRRWGDDFKGKRGLTLFNAIVENGEIEKLSGGMWTDIFYFGGRWYLCRYQEDDKGHRERIKDEIPFCYGFSLNAMEHDKSSSYPRIRTIIFDEFLTRTMYLNDEFILFMNTISTIARSRTDVKIFMLGNSVNKYCPYFAEMGLKGVKEQKQGTIDLYQYGDSKLTVAVEYVAPREGTGADGNLLFAFDNPKLKMVTHGDWEIDIYPHLPFRYKKKNILFEFFIKFDGELLHCEVLNGGYTDTKEITGVIFTYVHTKTTEIKNPDKDIIFQQDADPRPNYYTRITRPVDNLTQKIAWCFKRDKIFYQSNEVGEILNNYLKWSAN